MHGSMCCEHHAMSLAAYVVDNSMSCIVIYIYIYIYCLSLSLLLLVVVVVVVVSLSSLLVEPGFHQSLGKKNRYRNWPH